MHDAPLSMMNSFYEEELGKAIGEVIELDVDNEGIGWGSYLRVKVWLDISRLILKGKLINFARTQAWLSFKYECLPNFCFKWGVIKHPISGCNKSLVNSKLHDNEPA